MKAILPIRMKIAVLAVAGILPCFTAGAQGSLQSQLEAKYKLTKPTDDKSDIVTAGAVLVLQKDKLLMYPTSTQIPPVNTYSGGRLSEGAYGVHQKLQGFGSMIGHPPPQTIQGRQFVTGEKFWVTGIAVQPDGVLFTLFSDPYQDIRYYSQLKFIYPKGSNLSADQVLSLVGEVLTVEADDSAKSDDSGNQQQAAARRRESAARSGGGCSRGSACGSCSSGCTRCSTRDSGDRADYGSSDGNTRTTGKNHQSGHQDDLCLQGS